MRPKPIVAALAFTLAFAASAAPRADAQVTPRPSAAPAPEAIVSPAIQEAPPAQVRPPAPPAAPRPPREPQATAPPAPGEAPQPPRRPGQAINVRIEVTVTDRVSGKPPVSRTLTVTAADGASAQVRSNFSAQRARDTGISLDALPRLLDGGRIQLQMTLDYTSADATDAALASNNVRVRQEVVLESGKPLVIAEPADAMTDRRVTVEAKATILR